MTAKDMDRSRRSWSACYKQEAELEVWKQDRTGHFALLKTYPICRWSGDLGPKVREGDRQAPEGFYSITPAQMNPQSAYYLSFNIGYPNAFDKALGRTGSQLMVHGDCSSRGCYAMTDEQIAEIYALGRESFFGGQSAFQVQAYPFTMTPANMAKHRNNPNMPFWKMIKEGNDHFEVTKQEPKVDFCEKKYVFDAQEAGRHADLVFDASAKCPDYEVSENIANAVRDKSGIEDGANDCRGMQRRARTEHVERHAGVRLQAARRQNRLRQGCAASRCNVFFPQSEERFRGMRAARRRRRADLVSPPSAGATEVLTRNGAGTPFTPSAKPGGRGPASGVRRTRRQRPEADAVADARRQTEAKNQLHGHYSAHSARASSRTPAAQSMAGASHARADRTFDSAAGGRRPLIS